MKNYFFKYNILGLGIFFICANIALDVLAILLILELNLDIIFGQLASVVIWVILIILVLIKGKYYFSIIEFTDTKIIYRHKKTIYESIDYSDIKEVAIIKSKNGKPSFYIISNRSIQIYDNSRYSISNMGKEISFKTNSRKNKVINNYIDKFKDKIKG